LLLHDASARNTCSDEDEDEAQHVRVQRQRGLEGPLTAVAVPRPTCTTLYYTVVQCSTTTV
jgi:hypothetical protein